MIANTIKNYLNCLNTEDVCYAFLKKILKYGHQVNKVTITVLPTTSKGMKVSKNHSKCKFLLLTQKKCKQKESVKIFCIKTGHLIGKRVKFVSFLAQIKFESAAINERHEVKKLQVTS